MKEADIIEAIIRWIKNHGGIAHKVHGSAFQKRGEPDIDGALIVTGIPVHLKLEVKRKDGKASVLQSYRIQRYCDYGYCAGIVYSVEEVEELVLGYVLEQIKKTETGKH